MRTISATDANRQFSKILQEVRSGETVLITSRGRAVAQMGPPTLVESERLERDAALRDLLEHLRSRPAMRLGKFDRDELYDD